MGDGLSWTDTEPIALEPTDTTVLMAAAATLSGDLTVYRANHMRLHVENWIGTDDAFSWTVDASGGGTYEVTALIHGRGAELEIMCGRDKLRGTIERDGWRRLALGTFRLPPGVSTISKRATSLPSITNV